MKEADELNMEQLEKYIEVFLKENTTIFPEDFDSKSENYKKDFERSILIIKNVIIDLIKRQEIDYEDIEYLSAGAYSSVIRVGKFVVKLGWPRDNRGVPYSNYIIDALISINLMLGINIEVQNLVDAKWWEIKDKEGNVIRELSEEEIEEELFKLYVKLRKDGIVWKDIKKENVGRLLKANSSNLTQEYLLKDGKILKEEISIDDIDKEVIGRKEGEHAILPAGELVLIDRDFLIGKGAWTPKNPTREKGEEFNKRYEAIER